MIIWNPWHGCHRISEGCEHCYMYFLDGKRGVDTSLVTRTANFDLPFHRDRHGYIFAMRQTINIKRAYEPASAVVGYRVYIDRLWPRGLSHETFHYDV